MKNILLVLSLIFAGLLGTYAQNVSINNDGSEPDPSAALDVKSSDKGVLIPRVDFNNLPVSPATGLLVYVTANGPDGDNAFYYFDGTQWKMIEGGLTETDPVFSGGFDITGSQSEDMLKYDGTKYIKFTPSFTQSNFNYNSKYGIKLLARDDSHSNVDFVISPKGFGGILAQQPDGNTSGGNTRGNKSVDLQMQRNTATQVASGLYSVIVGGWANTASGQNSIAMGVHNVASGYSSNSIGSYTTAPSAFETVTGTFNTSYTPSSTLAWIATDRLFVVGNGVNDANKSNALTILKNANTTIGGSLTLNGNGTNTSIAFPTSRGTIGQVLTSDGSGGISWVSPSSGTVTGVSGTLPIVSTGGASPVISINAATTSTAGSMSAIDKTKLDGMISSQWTSSGANIFYNSGRVGIGTTSPLALLDVGNSVSNRKIILYSSADNDHEFTGLGINFDAFRLQIANTTGNFKFYGATSATTSNELFRIQGDGQIVIPALTTHGIIQNSTTGVLSSSKGTANQVLKMNATGTSTEWGSAVLGVNGTSPIVSTGGINPAISINPATTTTAGSMSAADKTKLDGVVSSQWTTSGSNIYYSSGYVGIGNSTPHAPLEFSNSIANRKIVFYTTADNDHQFTGFGLNGDALRFQLGNITGNFKFYGATSATTSNELFRIQGNGQIVIPAMTTQGIVQNSATGVLSSTKGTANQVLKMNSAGTATEWGEVLEPGTQTGQLLYWNDTIWETIDPGLQGQILKMKFGKPNWVTPALENLEIGDYYQGGYIFYFLKPGDPGYDVSIRHGLVVAPIEISAGSKWGCKGTDITGANGYDIGDGASNTFAIVMACTDVNCAARLCDDLVLDGYYDWYLPSKNELNQLRINRLAVGLPVGYYWSSTQSDADKAWEQSFANGWQNAQSKNVDRIVRAIRSF